MIEYKAIRVLENDSKEIPSYLKTVLNKETVPISYWFDFNMSFHWDKNKAFDRLMNLSDDTLLVTTPSFVGYDNSFDNYLLLFLKLKDLGKKVNIAVLYTDNFFIYLQRFVSGDSKSYLKKQNDLRMLMEVLEFHNVYEIKYTVSSNDNIGDNIHITPEYFMEYYFETSTKLGRTRVRVKETGKEYGVYSTYYHKSIEETELVLYIESDPNNKFLINQIEKI